MNHPKFLLVIAFLAGSSVTAMEISAARLLAPYFGTSLLVWTNVIGIVLAALSLGYYIGGRISEKRPQLHLLLIIIFISGWLCLITPWLVRPIFSILPAPQLFSQSGSLFIFLGSLILCALLFGLPIFLLGMTSPFLIKLRTLTHADAGLASGSIFASSTLGSILGTFTPTLLLIPTVGTKNTIAIFAAILIILGSFGFKSHAKKLISILLIIPFLKISPVSLKPSANLLEEKESVHQFIQVLKEGNITYLETNEGLGAQSVYNPNSTTTSLYYDVLAMLPRLAPPESNPVKVLIIGLAGGTIARGMNLEFGSKVNLDGVEIDQAMTDMGQKYFGLDKIPINIYHNDGRVFLQSTKEQYDVIIVDAYQNEVYIPWTMTTVEFWQTAKERLKPGGLVAINVNASSEDALLFQAITNTMANIFPHLTASPVSSHQFNYIVLASNQELKYTQLLETSDDNLKFLAEKIIANKFEVTFDPNKILLTDDRAPIEFLTDQMA